MQLLQAKIGSFIFRIDSLFTEIFFKIKVKVLALNVHMVPACTVGDFVIVWRSDAVTERWEGIGNLEDRLWGLVEICHDFLEFRTAPRRKLHLFRFSILGRLGLESSGMKAASHSRPFKVQNLLLPAALLMQLLLT